MNRRRPSPEELAARYAPAPIAAGVARAYARRAENREIDDAMTAEFHAATDRSGLPQPPRHRGITLPDNAPDKWEVDGD